MEIIIKNEKRLKNFVKIYFRLKNTIPNIYKNFNEYWKDYRNEWIEECYNSTCESSGVLIINKNDSTTKNEEQLMFDYEYTMNGEDVESLKIIF